jgi:hypothetical protein
LDGIDYGELPVEFRDSVKLMRSKCYASAQIHGSIRVYTERKGLIENPLLSTNLNINRIGELYSKQHNVSLDEGCKLAQFKIDELVSLQSHIQTAQIEAELALESATTVEQVLEIYRLAQLGLGMHNAFNIARML